MDIVFLDANVLFSAAYKSESNFLKLWELPDIERISSVYAAEEAGRNLERSEQRDRLEKLLRGVRFVEATSEMRLPNGVNLPAKDEPILLAAIAAKATHLLTGDWKHFGPYRNTIIEGVLILSTTAYFKMRPL
jgi:uncharacterized protein